MPTGVALTTRSKRSTSSMLGGAAHGAGQLHRLVHRVGAPSRHGHLGGAAGGQRQDDGASRPAGAEDQAAATVGSPMIVDAQGVEKTGTIGAVADQVVTPADHGVDGPQATGHRGQVIHRPGDSPLVRHGHGEPDDAQGAHGRHGIGAPARWHGEGDVNPVQLQGGEGRVVEDRRQRVPHGVADDPGHTGRRLR